MISWLQFGDLHACEQDDWASLELFRQLVASANANLVGQVDVAVLPGDNANHATEEQFSKIAEIARTLRLPLHALPGDHDFEAGSLDGFARHLGQEPLPYALTLAGARLLFLDIVSAGSGGPDFRLGASQTRWLKRELNAAQDSGQSAITFMHAYPGDLRAGADEVASILAAGGVRFVGTGHTHYNELLNDGRVIYAATRSTGEIEEPGGPGFSLGALDGDAVSWRFKALDAPWPFTLITAPADVRLMTDPQSRTQVPEAEFPIRAKVFGADVAAVSARLGTREIALADAGGGVWSASSGAVEPGLHTLAVTARSSAGNEDTDRIDVLVRPPRERPRRSETFALGRDLHSVGPWPARGIPGGQLGPNKNGLKW
ncbi:metallophosphoesterase family protein [Aureimonas pseudogalii]|uniref:Putative phosphodiesterase n=1 Tax=Aureimonas pseudogalii TaxID=1744844 RepID=A0A7W6MKZ0_9HYPH|nr:metallophosphoesterase [Aureimonas pseudogalii]MBB3999329.1 putative phosphodiesterase [Aureimonas pseudogalii]